jgi:CheY-like chemotaxis protein
MAGDSIARGRAVILIVDDVPEIVTWLVEAVRDEGYHPDFSMDGWAAIYKMARVYYAMALIDIRLSGDCDGNDVARRVKRMPPPFCDVPMVAMSGGRIEPEDGLFVAILRKPFLPRDLHAVIIEHALPRIADIGELSGRTS